MSGSENATDRLAELLADCHDDPDLFNSAVLGRSPYWWRQREICESICTYKQTIVYSGNAIGKDYLLGGIVPWWLYTRPRSLAIVTGPSQTLLGSVTWKEIRLALADAVIPLKPRLSSGVKSSPLICAVDAGRGWQALGYSTTSVERASGQHNPNLLVLVEEASAVEDEIWEAMDSLGYAKLLAVMNPIRADGEAVRRIHQAEEDRRNGVPAAEAINAIRIPSTDSPHIEWDRSPWGLADRSWLNQIIRRYGRDSLYVRSHCDAILPKVSDEQLIPSAWLDWSIAQQRPQLPANHPVHQTRRIAIDLGEGVSRDSTVVMVGDQLGVLDCVVSNLIGLPEAAALAAAKARQWNVPPNRVSYDLLGPGRRFRNHLAAHGLEAAIGYAGEASPRDKSAFVNIRTEAAWQARHRLDPNHVADPRRPFAAQAPYHFAPGPYIERLRRELAALTTSLAGKGQSRLLSKEDWTAKLGASPDVADAFLQLHAFA